MNKRIVVLGLLVVVMSVSALGAGFMGPPTAKLKQGQWSAGYNYMYSDMDLEKTKMTLGISLDDDMFDFAEDFLEDVGIDDADDLRAISYSYKAKIKDVKTQRHYATIGYGVADNWEVYFQLGGADVKAKTDDFTGKMSYNFDNDFAWGWGTRITFCEQDNISWGTSVQMNWLDTSWDDSETLEDDDITINAKYDVDIDYYDLLIAVGPTVDMGGWSLYGGPFFYYLSGDIEVKDTLSTDVGTAVLTASGDLKADSNFGGFIGAQFDLSESTDLTTEFSFTGDSWAFGTGVTWKF